MSDLYDIPQLGKLEILEVFDYHNEPILFSCCDEKQNLYIALYANDLPEHEMWLFAKVSLEKLNFIRSGEINLYDTFVKPEKKHLLKVLIPHWNCESATFHSDYVLPEELDNGVFLSSHYRLNLTDEFIFPVEQNLHENEYLFNGQEIDTTIDFFDDRHEAPADFLSMFFKHVQSIVNQIRVVQSNYTNVVKAIHNDMQLFVLPFQKGSFTIKIVSKEQPSSFEETTTIQHDAISEFINLLQSKDSELEFKNKLIELQPGVSKEYNKLLELLNKIDANTTFTWTSPYIPEGKKVSFLKREIPKLIHSLQELNKEEVTTIQISGHLTALNLTQKTFEIQTKDQPYRGAILKDYDTSIENAIMSLMYKGTVRQILKKNKVTDKIVKTKYVLLKLEKS